LIGKGVLLFVVAITPNAAASALCRAPYLFAPAFQPIEYFPKGILRAVNDGALQSVKHLKPKGYKAPVDNEYNVAPCDTGPCQQRNHVQHPHQAQDREREAGDLVGHIQPFDGRKAVSNLASKMGVLGNSESRCYNDRVGCYIAHGRPPLRKWYLTLR